MTKEYRTVSSMVLMFKWRISKESFSKTAMILTTWPGILLDIVLRSTFDPEILASTSATGELQLAPSSLKVLLSIVMIIFPKGLSGGWNCLPGLGLRLFLRFLASNDCTTWCNSLMNSITPPIIDAWSPFNSSTVNQIYY